LLHASEFIALPTQIRPRRGDGVVRDSGARADYLALGDEAGLGDLPGGSPAGGVAEGEDDGAVAGGRGGDGRAEERERRVEAHHGGRRGIIFRRVVGAAGEGHLWNRRQAPADGGGGGRRCECWARVWQVNSW